MRATGPTTRSAHSFYKFPLRPLDPAAPRFWLLGGFNPADPFVSREWRNIFPFSECRSVRNKGLSQILWDRMYHTSGDLVVSLPNHFFFGHISFAANLNQEFLTLLI